MMSGDRSQRLPEIAMGSRLRSNVLKGLRAIELSPSTAINNDEFCGARLITA